MVVESPTMRAGPSMMPTTEEVMTMRLMVGWESAEFRMEVVPFMAGRMISFSGSSVCGFISTNPDEFEGT